MPGFFFCKSGNGLEEAAMNQAPVGLENGADRAASSRENPVLFPAPRKKLGKNAGLLFCKPGNGLEEDAMNQTPVGLENRIVYNLVDVVEGNCRIKQAMIKDKKYPNLFLLPSAQTRDKTSVTPEQMSKLVEELKSEFDYIILDCPAGIEQGFKNAFAAADRALIVTTPEVSAIRDADRIIGLLEANDIHKIDLVINRIRMDMVERGDMLSKDDVLDILAVDLIGIVPDDENIVISTNQGEPLVGSNTPAGKAYQNICNRVMGKDVPFMEITGPSFFQRLANVFKK